MGIWKRIFGKEQPQLNDEEAVKSDLEAFKKEKRSIVSQERARFLKARDQLELKRLELQIRRDTLELENQIADLENEHRELTEEEDDDEEDEGQEDQMLAKLFEKILTQPQKVPTAAEIPPSTTPPVVSISKAEMEQYWRTMDKGSKAIAKTFDDDTLQRYIMHQIPNIDSPSLKQAIEIVRTQS